MSLTVRPDSPAAALCPAQQDALEALSASLSMANIVGFVAPAGCGTSTVLHHLVRRHGGCVVDIRDFIAATRDQPANRTQELISACIAQRVLEHRLVAVDDFDLIQNLGGTIWRPRWLMTWMKSLALLARACGTRLVLSGAPLENWEAADERFGSDSVLVSMRAFDVRDYAAIVSHHANRRATQPIDFARLHAHSAHLNAHQLRLGVQLAERGAELTAKTLIHALDTHVTGSNTRLEEVEEVRFEDLAGHEEIIESLLTHVVMPMERLDLAQQLGIRPKRGVLLYGPPGTGKTSIGRALAHRMKGKFFLIDGTFVTEPEEMFFFAVQAVVERAKRSAPAVLFIDDADLLFGLPQVAGLSRYLLSLLDGIESQTASQLCVMMTAMDASRIPAALLRSGRVELWLEACTPDVSTRRRILRHWLSSELPAVAESEIGEIADRCEGFTPADMRRLVGDAAALFGADLVRGRSVRSTAGYLGAATDAMLAMRQRMAEIR